MAASGFAFAEKSGQNGTLQRNLKS